MSLLSEVAPKVAVAPDVGHKRPAESPIPDPLLRRHRTLRARSGAGCADVRALRPPERARLRPIDASGKAHKAVGDVPTSTGFRGLKPSPTPKGARRISMAFSASCTAMVILCVLVSGFGCAKRQRPVSHLTTLERHLKKGSRLLAAGSYPSAIKEFERALELEPDNLEAHLGLGLTYLHTTYYKGALEEFESALEIDEESAEGHYGMGAVKFQLGDTTDAEVHFKRTIVLEPDYALAYYSLGVINEGRGSDARAQEYYEGAVSRDPALTEAHYNLGVLYARTDQLNEAIGSFVEVKSLAPDLLEARIALAEAYRRTGKLDASLEELDYAYNLAPFDAEVHSRRGLTLLAMDMVDESASSFKKALTIQPDHYESLMGLAEAETRQGDVSRAELTLRRAVEADSSSIEARFKLALALAAQGRNSEAIEQLRQAVRLNPGPKALEKLETLLDKLQGEEAEEAR